jgi:monovalent cation:proton antiporter-2 (CPA2) family protein
MEKDLLVQIMVFFSAAVVMVPIARKLGLGSVLGYLIAGMLIGPYLLGFISDGGQESIMHFAEFGVVMMLFLVGLELDPKRLWHMRVPIVGLGSLQMVISAVAIALFMGFWGYAWNESLAIGLIMAMSSTAIVIQIFKEKGLLKAASGQNAIAVLLFQDLALIPLLAFLPMLALKFPAGNPGHSVSSAIILSQLPTWAEALTLIGAVIAVVLGGKFIVGPLLKMVARSSVRELFTATALLIVVTATFVMTRVGLSPAMGTFLAGVVLANSEFRHELVSDIEPFKGLLLGLFFMAVGASINFDLLLQSPFKILFGVFMIMTIKGVILMGLGRLFHLSWEQSILLAFGLSEVGEFAFVLFSFTAQQNILSAEAVQQMVVIVAISMALTPVVLLLGERVLLPLLGRKEEEPEPDAFEEHNPMIIAGYGNFGSTVGRFLNANGIETTVLELNSDRVELLRKMGIKVYYGDATRLDLLRAAGAAEAQGIVIAMENPDRNLELVETVKKYFPNLHMFVRSIDREDAYDLMDAGILHIYRQNLEASLRMGADALHFMGTSSPTAYRKARLFLEHEEKGFKKLAAARHDKKRYISIVREQTELMNSLIQSDLDEEIAQDLSLIRKRERDL